MKSHDQENITTVRHFYDGASKGELGPAREALDPNVEWIERDGPGLSSSGTHRGADAVWNELIEPSTEKFEDFRIKMNRLYAVGDHVIAIGHCRGRARATGRELNTATAHVCTLRNGKIVRFEVFHDSVKWLETLGLGQPEQQRMAA